MPRIDTYQFHRLTPLIGLCLFAIASIIIWRTMHTYHWSDIKNAFVQMPASAMVASVIVALVGYMALSMYDVLGMHYAKETLPYRQILLASFLGYAISNNVGHALVSGGTMRYRIYSRWGLPAASIARIILFCSSSYVVGAVILLISIYCVMNFPTLPSPSLPPVLLPVLISGATLLFILWWIVIFKYAHRPLSFKGFKLYLPTPLLGIQQSFVAICDILLAGLVLYIPLYTLVHISFGTFLLIYLIAQLMGLSSQIPGGMGVFEGSFLLLAPPEAPPASVLAALIICRIAYYFIPLGIAGCIWLAYEARYLLKKQRTF